MERVLPPRGVEGSVVDGIGGGAFLWFFLVAVDKKEQGKGMCHGFVCAHHDTHFYYFTFYIQHFTLSL